MAFFASNIYLTVFCNLQGESANVGNTLAISSISSDEEDDDVVSLHGDHSRDDMPTTSSTPLPPRLSDTRGADVSKLFKS